MSRILYLHQYFGTLQSADGTRSYEMARRLVADGHDVVIVTTTANLGESCANDPGWQTCNVEGIHVEALSVPYSNKMNYAQRIRAFLHFAVAAAWHVKNLQADVVFATSTPLTIAIPGIAARLWHRIPLVFEVRDLWPELPIAVGALRNPLAKTAARWLEWIAYRASAHVVVLSPGMAEGVIRRGIPASRVTVIPNSCDVSLFDVPKQRGEWVRESLGIDHKHCLVIYTGTFGAANGVGYLVEIAAAMQELSPNVHFLLVGGGAEEEKVRAQAERLGVLNETLRIWPPIAKSQIPDLLAAATIATSVVIPLQELWVNSANKFFDALAARKPIAINYEGWQAELLREHNLGIVLPCNDAASAARLLLAYINQPCLLEKAAENAYELACTKFNRDEQYNLLRQVLEDAVAP